MQIFKAFFKIVNKNKFEMFIYIIVFLAIAIGLSSSNTGVQNGYFNATKLKMVFINNDEDSVLVEGLRDYLAENAILVDIDDNKKELQDALFFREIEYIVRVPAGFTNDLQNGKEVQLEYTKVPDSTTGVFLNNLVNKYLNAANLYAKSLDITEEKLAEYIKNDLANEVEVVVNSFETKSETNSNHIFYFNYMAYSIFAILILGVCVVMLVFNGTDLKRRNYCSPIKIRSINLQLASGNLVFALLTWFIMIIASFFLYTNEMFTLTGLLLLANSLIFTVAVLSISFLISNVVRSRGALSAAANVVALGSSFISGVFVPQQFISSEVLNIASFTPTYWYIRANNIIANISTFSFENLKPVFTCMLIILAFAVAILAITLVIAKQKRTSK
ncbi:MAG: hypothetical protein A2Y17_05170 [Clostridiales bacterium GWF2_38_85]|nr:MAG: hypothetical protein A2Y17_05170 [Clostridiales bacterium GWF2_38_85]HBL84826.1 ABC transporter permease [Clostridiales bacterium]